MYIKHPIELLKKKVNADSISYKFKWSNNSVSIEPFTQLTQEMLVLVNNYELKQLGYDPQEPKPSKHIKLDSQNTKCIEEQKKEGRPSERSDKILDKTPEKQKQSKDSDSIQTNINSASNSIAHKPRKSKNCQVKSVRHNDGKIEFLVSFDDSTETKWTSLDEMKIKAPLAVCEFLLGKVKYGGGASNNKK
ncbi:unnamed protein product [Paramecium sonneborni]|uniref:Chromo domain-containing protein n=1 Tax=Paramecium sonneborni TaxID=65129 RepID=A0A8S1KW13_9CILI|nr:unnamed protein product [Paramecium sonneborni]